MVNDLDMKVLRAVHILTQSGSISQEFQSEQSGGIINQPITISTYTLVELLLSLAVDNSDEHHPATLFHRQSDDDNDRLIKLRNREINIGIGTRLPADKAIIQLRFFDDNAGVLASMAHPPLREKVTQKGWQTNRHADWRHRMPCKCATNVTFTTIVPRPRIMI
ncbi:TPA: hypothetical protein JG914_004672 [Enterobacter hormaechei subsp. steigerwaltii]|nr:hypothetical protein [Enterobacter hormaechei subsp. steigerwaltii]